MSAVLDMRSHPKYYIFYTSRVSGAITDLLFCIEGVVAMDPEHDAHKQLKAIVIITPRTRDKSALKSG